jgi:hypothetical protein
MPEQIRNYRQNGNRPGTIPKVLSNQTPWEEQEITSTPMLFPVRKFPLPDPAGPCHDQSAQLNHQAIY